MRVSTPVTIDRVGEQKTSAGPEQPSPFCQQRGAMIEMVHSVDTDNGVEGALGKGQWFACIHSLEFRPVGQATRLGRISRRKDAALVNVDPGDVTARGVGGEKRRPARATRDIEHARVGLQFQPAKELPQFTRCDPAKLPDIVAIGLASDLGQDTGSLPGVNGIETRSGALGASRGFLSPTPARSSRLKR